MARRVRWGVLGVAKIATRKVVPAMRHCKFAEVLGFASRDRGRAAAANGELGLPRSYDSYEALLADPEIEAVYNPLPNHLHVPWSIRAAEAGKHVLCEKPLGLNAGEVKQLIAARDRSGVLIGEAFMVRHHPQWLRAESAVRSGEIGRLRALWGAFSYYNDDAKNIRNVPAFGGGALMDIGCYPIAMSRFLFDAEPLRVAAVVERDERFGTDRLSSALLEFAGGQASFICSTQLVPYQRVQIFGERGRIEIEIPFNAPPDRACRILFDRGEDVFGSGIRAEQFAICDQYTLQADDFSRAILERQKLATPLEDALRNMAVIDAIRRAGQSGGWERPDINA